MVVVAAQRLLHLPCRAALTADWRSLLSLRLTDLQVAQQLLLRGLPEVDAVVFLDGLDRKMALLRVGFKVVELAECGVALERRFTFYDQVHTTGMDIEQLLSAHAVLTLGKDMVFRDFAQVITPSM